METATKLVLVRASDDMGTVLHKLRVLREMFVSDADMNTCKDGLCFITNDIIDEICDIIERLDALRNQDTEDSETTA